MTAAFLKSLDQTPFFDSMRMLTVLGMFAAPKYAGNYAGAGWKLLGFEWRFHEIDFHERSVLGSISGTGFADWPISYQELEPYYMKVEWEVGVSDHSGTCLPGGGTYRTFCAPQRNLM